MIEDGRQLGNYRLEGELGRGGMAVVYRARHRTLGSSHAVKLLLVNDAALSARLLREGKAQAALAHPNVLPVTDVVDAAGALALVMPYIEGPSLEAALRATSFDLDEVDALMRGILAGMAAAHSRRFVHRDLKPANVLLDLAGETVTPRVADFGLVRTLDEGAPGRTRTGAVMGTPAYMSPEQVRDSSRADERSDVFALGVLAYELLSGRTPFVGPDAFATMLAVTEGDYPPLDDRAVPASMRETIAAALSKDPGDRPMDAAAMLKRWTGSRAPPAAWSPARWDALRDIATRRSPSPSESTVGDGRATFEISEEDSEAAEAEEAQDGPRRAAPTSSPSAPPTVAPTAAPRRGIARGPAAALGAGIAFALVGLYALTDRVPEANEVDAPLEGMPLVELPDSLHAQSASLSPDGRSALWVAGSRLVVRDLDTQEERSWPLEDRIWRGLAVGRGFAILGSQAGAGGKPGPMWRIDLASGAREPLGRDGFMPAVAPNGGRLAWTDGRAIWAMDLEEGAARTLFTLPFPDDAVTIAWSPDGAWLLAQITDFPRKTGEIRLLAFDGSAAHRLDQAPEYELYGRPGVVAWPTPELAVVSRRGDGAELWSFEVDAETGKGALRERLVVFEGPMISDLSVAGDRLLALPAKIVRRAFAVRTDEPSLDAWEIHADRRGATLIGWLDATTPGVSIGGQSDALVAVLPGGTRRLPLPDGAPFHDTCVSGAGIAVVRPDSVQLVRSDGSILPLLPAGGTTVRVDCAPDEVWVMHDRDGRVRIDGVDITSGAARTGWVAPPGMRPHAFAADPRGAFLVVLLDERQIRVDLVGGGTDERPQPIAYPDVEVDSEGRTWIAGVAPDTTLVIERDDGLRIVRPAQPGRPRATPDGTMLGWTERHFRADPWLASFPR